MVLLLALLTAAIPPLAWSAAPLESANQNPFTQNYGLPAPESARVLPAGGWQVALKEDGASNFVQESTARESLLLDGESYRTTLTIRHGLADGWEAGVDLPVVGQGGGIFDGFIDGWHRFFHLPRGGRDRAPRNRLLYSYNRDGREEFRLADSGWGIGDISFNAARQLVADADGAGRHALALRGSVKLPTGNSNRTQGSGSLDAAVALAGGSDYRLAAGWGEAGLFASLGGMALSRGGVLVDQQRHLVGFATVGGAWTPTPRVTLILQLTSNTPFYHGSDLATLSANSLQLLMGGRVALAEKTALDLGVGEDLSVSTAPDVTLHLRLSRHF